MKIGQNWPKLKDSILHQKRIEVLKMTKSQFSAKILGFLVVLTKNHKNEQKVTSTLMNKISVEMKDVSHNLTKSHQASAGSVDYSRISR